MHNPNPNYHVVLPDADTDLDYDAYVERLGDEMAARPSRMQRWLEGQNLRSVQVREITGTGNGGW